VVVIGPTNLSGLRGGGGYCIAEEEHVCLRFGERRRVSRADQRRSRPSV